MQAFNKIVAAKRWHSVPACKLLNIHADIFFHLWDVTGFKI